MGKATLARGNVADNQMTIEFFAEEKKTELWPAKTWDKKKYHVLAKKILMNDLYATICFL